MSRFIPSSYRHTQDDPATTWTINHNFGGSGCKGVPVIDVIVHDVNNSNMLSKIIPQNITMINANSLTVTFSSPLSGFATLIG